MPQRPNLGFTGQPGDIWYVFVIQGLCTYAGFSDAWYPAADCHSAAGVSVVDDARWIVANISSDGHPLAAHL